MNIELKKSASSIEGKICEKARKSDLIYVVTFWTNSISKDLNHRCAYFDSVMEAVIYQEQMENKYKGYGFPYYICSSVLSLEADGGLFDDHSN